MTRKSSGLKPLLHKHSDRFEPVPPARSRISKLEAPEAGTSTVFLYPLSAFIEERLTASDRIHAFDFTSNANESPWRGFRGILAARGDCIIHVEVTGYDHG